MQDDKIPPQDEPEVDERIHEVPEDQRIDPDLELQGYQEDVNTGGGNDEPEREQDETPEDYLQMSQRDLHEALNQTATNEKEDTDNIHDDWREHIEDMDEADKSDRR